MPLSASVPQPVSEVHPVVERSVFSHGWATVGLLMFAVCLSLCSIAVEKGNSYRRKLGYHHGGKHGGTRVDTGAVTESTTSSSVGREGERLWAWGELLKPQIHLP